MNHPGLFRHFHGAFHPRIWVHIVEQTGCVDEALFPNLGVGRPDVGRRLVGLVLGGSSQARFREHTWALRAGDGLTCDGRGLFRGRAESCADEPALSVNIDWDAAYFGSARLGSAKQFRSSNVARLSRKVADVRSAIQTAATSDASHVGATDGVTQPLVALLDLLRADGLDVPRVTPTDLATTFDPEVRRVSRALDRVFSRTEEMPMLVDLEGTTGLSARTVQRTLPSVLSAWGHVADHVADTFRSLRSRLQLVRACLVMSHLSATTERAAEILGFSSPNALCRTFVKHGLPSPGQVRSRLSALL